MNQLIIDRFENGLAICEAPDGQILEIPRERLPAAAREGDVLISSEDGELRLDRAATKARRARVRKKMDRLFK